MMDWDTTTQTGARTPGADRRCGRSNGGAHRMAHLDSERGACVVTPVSTKGGSKPSSRKGMPGAGLTGLAMGRRRLKGQPWSRTGENPPYGILEGTMETSASFEARSAPSSYSTPRHLLRRRQLLPVGRHRCTGKQGETGTVLLFDRFQAAAGRLLKRSDRKVIPSLSPPYPHRSACGVHT